MINPGNIARTLYRVNVRATPGLTGPILRTLAPGLEVRALQAQTVDGLEWWDTGSGWIAATAPDGTQLLEDSTPAPAFDRALAFVLRWEGGYSTDKNDPGNYTGGRVGAGSFKGTKYGISAAAYPNVDIANLTLQDAGAIYQRDYWQPSGADGLAWPLALAHFDTAVNMGLGRAADLLAQADKSAAIYMALRLRTYATFGTFPNYGAAWVNRCAELLEIIGHDVPLWG